MKPSCVTTQVNISSYSSWKVGGAVDFFAQPKNEQDLKNVLLWALAENLPVTVIGGGTNILIHDSGIRGLVISSCQLQGWEEKKEKGYYLLSVMSGVAKHEIMRVYMKQKLAPALFLSGLPGNIGGGVAMNAGIREDINPREFTQIVDWVEVYQWNKEEGVVFKKYSHDQLKWGYRHCFGWQPGMIFRVGLKWPDKPDENIRSLVMEANKRRLSKQPLDKLSCGSVFKNPSEYSSGFLIEDSGLKGFRIGGAEVSKKHANFIINTGEASAQNIFDLIEHVRLVVKQKKGIQLESEVVLVGF